jgi:hypothetical protein
MANRRTPGRQRGAVCVGLALLLACTNPADAAEAYYVLTN